jgi:hypothetical protein
MGGERLPVVQQSELTREAITSKLEQLPQMLRDEIARVVSVQEDVIRFSTSGLALDSDSPAEQTDVLAAVYILDDDLKPRGVRSLPSIDEQLPWDPSLFYRVYLDDISSSLTMEQDDDDPHADIFVLNDGRFCISYDFVPTASPEHVERLEGLIQTRRFQISALRRWGRFKVIWGGPGGSEVYDLGGNLLIYYDDTIAFVNLIRVEPQPQLTFKVLLEDYVFLRETSRAAAQR